MALLSQALTRSRPSLQTRKALLVLDLQNDFITPNGKLPVTLLSGFENDTFVSLVSAFRESGEVTWVCTECSSLRSDHVNSYEQDTVIVHADPDLGPELVSPAEDSEEALLRSALYSPHSLWGDRPSASRMARAIKRVSGASKRHAALSRDMFLADINGMPTCCIPGSEGINMAHLGASILDPARDIQIMKHRYSAFNATNLLTTLRSRLVTELYLCGSLTNIAVHATASDAVRHGFMVHIVEDCLGYRNLAAHDEALSHMIDFMGVIKLSAQQLIFKLQDDTINHTHTLAIRSKGIESSKLSSRVASARGSETAAIYEPGGELRTISLSLPAVPTMPAVPASSLETPPFHMRPESRRQHADESGDHMSHSDLSVRSKKYTTITNPPHQDDSSQSGKYHQELPPAPASLVDRATTGVSNDVGITGSLHYEDPARSSDHSRLLRRVSAPSIDRATANMSKHQLVSVPSGTQINVASAVTSATDILEKNLQPETAVCNDFSRKSKHERRDSRPKNRHTNPVQHPVLGPGDIVGEGDSRVVYDVLSGLGPNIFSDVKNEVYWQKMYHAQGEVPRLVCTQGSRDPSDGSIPVYRHPSDQTLPLLYFSHTVQAIKDKVQQIVGHPMNHVLIQLYRGGHDFISEHSDKTLDIVRGSSIVNVSIGAQRTMRLRTKRTAAGLDGSRKTQLVPLLHGSVFVLGLHTNMAWLHGINADKRPSVERSEEEKDFHGERISLTFRHIGTFLDSDCNLIWGQGACAKVKSDAHMVVNGDPQSTEKLINAFGFENQQTAFDWDATYGCGFDVLHFTAPPVPQMPLLFLSGDSVTDLRVKIYLEELSLPYHTAGASRADAGRDYRPALCFRDTGPHKTQVYGDVPTLMYLDRTYAGNSLAGPVLARALRLMWDLHSPGTDHAVNPSPVTPYSDVLGPFPGRFLNVLDTALAGHAFVAGEQFSIADCAVWPVVEDIVETWAGWHERGCWPRVAEYYSRILKYPSVERAMWSDARG